MDLFHLIVEMIDLRSFSNLWYWIALGVLWSSASHWVLGVPFDMVGRASKGHTQSEQDLHDAVRIQTNRILYIYEVSGVLLIALLFFVVTTLCLLGFVHGVEFAQAVALMVVPMIAVAVLNLNAARRLNRVPHDTEALCRRLSWTRLYIQLLGVVSILVTSLWGMLQNLSIGVLG